MEQNMSTNFKTESQKSAPAPTIREVKGVPRPRAQGFMLEVLKQVEHVHPEGWHCNGHLHVGYMQKIFKRKPDGAHNAGGAPWPPWVAGHLPNLAAGGGGNVNALRFGHFQFNVEFNQPLGATPKWA